MFSDGTFGNYPIALSVGHRPAQISVLSLGYKGSLHCDDKGAFYAIKCAIARARPDLVESIQGREEIERMTLEIAAAIKEAGLRLVKTNEAESSAGAGTEDGTTV